MLGEERLLLGSRKQGSVATHGTLHPHGVYVNVCCYPFCIQGDCCGRVPPVPAHHSNVFKTSLIAAPCNESCCCLFGFFCGPFAACLVRSRALDENLTKYSCCQGYLQHMCLCCPAPGQCGEYSCPIVCLIMEAVLCLPCSFAATRMYVMDKFEIKSSGTGAGPIRLTNCVQVIQIIADIVLPSLSYSWAITAVAALDPIAECLLALTMGCMTAQMVHEMRHQERNAPMAQAMIRADPL